jgi:hypothetical protein
VTTKSNQVQNAAFKTKGVNNIMNHTLLSLCALLVIANPGLDVLQTTQNDPGKQVAVTPLAPTISGYRTSFTAGLVSDQLRLVVRDRDTWVQVWNRISPGPNSPPMPEIDFKREILIVAAMGLRPSSGYQIIIDKAYLYERYPRLEVVVRSIDNTKCPGLGVFTSITAPIDVVRLPRTEYPVVLREIEGSNCPKLK